jgi:hypothetical protein
MSSRERERINANLKQLKNEAKILMKTKIKFY